MTTDREGGAAGARDGRHTRWDEHRSERRTQILDAAIAVIESNPPGSPVHVRQIAERAGLARPVVYRHFADRADLDHAVNGRILALVREEIFGALHVEGTIEQIIGRAVSAYVHWAAEHPALHRFASEETPREDGPNELQRSVTEIGEQVTEFLRLLLEMIEVPVTEEDARDLGIMVAGLVGMAFGAVRFWLAAPTQDPPAEVLAAQLSRSVWFVLEGHARERGLVVDPTVPLEQLVVRSS